MEKIGSRRILTYADGTRGAEGYGNAGIRRDKGHFVASYFELARKVADIQFRNRDYVFLFRGQSADHLTSSGSSNLKASLFRLDGKKLPTQDLLTKRFSILREAEVRLAAGYKAKRFIGSDRLRRYRVLRSAILQHYEVCRTPLLDVTQSLRIAASFASLGNETCEAFVFIFGVPNLSGAVTASSEAGLQVVRLSSACPPRAVRPHLQEGYLLGEYPEIGDYDQNIQYGYHGMDFGRRLIGKFRFDPRKFWDPIFPCADQDSLRPRGDDDPLLDLAQEIKTYLQAGSRHGRPNIFDNALI